jgi:thymidylate synthase
MEMSETKANQSEERQYLDLVARIIKEGVKRDDRTGTGTKSLFGVSMKFNLRNKTLPLLTTKKCSFKNIAAELLFFISGSTNCNVLHDQGVRIWDDDTSRATLDKRGFKDRPEGDLGPGYSFQWRHAGANYKDMHTDYTGQGIDQLQMLIHEIKKNPTSRRLILNSWNVKDVPQMSLPPCHVMVQFYVANGELSSLMYQRSADFGLGVPYNIASYALLTHILAHVCDLQPGDFIHMIGDAHVYSNHEEALQKQLLREPMAFPTLTIDPNLKDIDKLTLQHIKLENYKSHEAIYMKLSV